MNWSAELRYTSQFAALASLKMRVICVRAGSASLVALPSLNNASHGSGPPGSVAVEHST